MPEGGGHFVLACATMLLSNEAGAYAAFAVFNGGAALHGQRLLAGGRTCGRGRLTRIVDVMQFLAEGKARSATMKRAYEKPALIKRERLSVVTAAPSLSVPPPPPPP
ncbi:hypothetical protein EN851_23290 [Mesorhizobium sp. M8A.F.Ca.ET.208.01.1.1]|nr:hypothetical protein EN851_23290 [Mesorhizobium sp. M8A.F.Ca.ET.208.01.1.1]TGR32300.1 hypothetical protein EN845_07105 [Mesorhizobium sp. M8A.F.Ca.ET.202.01.1.1]TGT50516.1 hypothetical protein EN810_23190 [Mesorhizobium sp. M8A.F.Ca.ET.167.01.1.1]TGU40180.1 hypothetical protein EN799_07105 [bacterium M00.F.Ca.ET.156.01.1.1]TIT33996.1 MAG: hypothetical protein E5W65_19035 [Mesorhizobium sp.]